MGCVAGLTRSKAVSHANVTLITIPPSRAVEYHHSRWAIPHQRRCGSHPGAVRGGARDQLKIGYAIGFRKDLEVTLLSRRATRPVTALAAEHYDAVVVGA